MKKYKYSVKRDGEIIGSWLSDIDNDPYHAPYFGHQEMFLPQEKVTPDDIAKALATEVRDDVDVGTDSGGKPTSINVKRTYYKLPQEYEIICENNLMLQEKAALGLTRQAWVDMDIAGDDAGKALFRKNIKAINDKYPADPITVKSKSK